MKKSCATCKHWDLDDDGDDGDTRPCTWSSATPFWASIDNGDHADWTAPADGARCATFEKREEDTTK